MRIVALFVLWLLPVMGTVILIGRGRRVVQELDASALSPAFRPALLGFLWIYTATLLLIGLGIVLTVNASAYPGLLLGTAIASDVIMLASGAFVVFSLRIGFVLVMGAAGIVSLASTIWWGLLSR